MFGLSDSVVGAVLGACITLIGLIVSKEGKISEFRQAWIDKLREDIAAYIEIITKIESDRRDCREQDLAKYATANLLASRIRLRLNPNEKESVMLSEAIIRPVPKHSSPEPAPDDVYQENLTVIVEATQNVLRKEWKRVKQGEPIYRCVFGVCVTVVAIAILTAACRYLTYHLHSW